MIEFNVQSPSLESLGTVSDRYASSPSHALAQSCSSFSHVSHQNSTRSKSAISSSYERNAAEKGLTVTSIVPDPLPERMLKEIIPSEGPRYNRQVSVQNVHYGFEVPSLCFDFPQGDQYDDWAPDPDLRGWEPRTHPEGSLYFYHQEKRIFTEACLYLPNYLEEVEQLVIYLQQLLQAQPAAPPSADYELVVQITFDKSEVEKGILWQYYYVDHKTRSLFWLRPFEVGEHLTAVCGEVCPAHFKHMLESWYWDHVALFPDNFESHDYLVEEVIGHLTFFGIDLMTAPTTTVQYTLKELTNMIRLLGTKEPGAGAVPIAAALGRVMADFCHWRFLHYHGQRSARLNRFESAREPSVAQPPRTWLMQLFSILFLFAPETHLRDLEKICVDGLVVGNVWRRHISKLQGEWEEFIQYATIILTASVSMLSVPDVILFPDNPNPPGGGSNIQSYLPPLHSPAAIASYISILCSIGSIVLGLMLVHHNRTRSREDPLEAAAYMQQQNRSYFHYEPLAILYSLPYALLMWSMLSFATSVMIFTLDKTDLITQSTIAVISFAISCLIVWCTIATWFSEKPLPLKTLWNTMKQVLIANRGHSDDASDTLVGDNATSEKSEMRPRVRLRLLANKIRRTTGRIPCVNDV
ncbi:hypothetical protein PENSPDRAFT_754574 [Peniophora sp. CONT]|nr:hypothetical protein PENSPDRAFT_754574 [Peniophora sp. CONT]